METTPQEKETIVAIVKPGGDERRRCVGCADPTWFGVTRTVRSEDFVHRELSGAGVVAEHRVLSETVAGVRCRRCCPADAVQAVSRPGAARSGRVAESVPGQA